jgi:hypothetical protein
MRKMLRELGRAGTGVGVPGRGVCEKEKKEAS